MLRPARHGRRRPAALLLEVVVALAIMVAAVGLLSGQLANGLRITEFAESQMQAANVTDRVLAMVELDPNTQEKLAELGESQTLELPVGLDYPGYFFTVRVDPIEPDNEDLFVVKVAVLRQTDPTNLESADGAEIVRQVGYLKAPPSKLNAESLGLTPDALAGAGLPPEWADQIGPLLGMLSGGDASNLSIQQFINSLDPETLSQLIPMIQSLLAQGGLGSGFALDPSLLGSIPGLGGLPGAGGGQPGAGGAPGGQGGSPEGLAEMIRNAAGGKGGKGGSGGAGPANPNPVQPQPRGGRNPAGGGRASGGGGRQPAGVPQARPPQGNVPRGGTGQRPPNPNSPQLTPGGGSGEGGRYTIEDLMRLRDEMQQGGG